MILHFTQYCNYNSMLINTLSSLQFQCTKSKAWKEIAAQLGIGASSSGAYTLKKHYGKNLLAFECQFDRGGIDPAPILAQVEAAQNKGKKPKAGANNAGSQPPPAPSPGSQDSRDSTTFSNSSNQTNSEAPYPSGPAFGPGGPSGPPPPGAPPGAPGYGNYPPTGAPPNDGRPPSHPGRQHFILRLIISNIKRPIDR